MVIAKKGNGENMSTMFDLTKKVEFVLTKRGILNIPCQVKLCMDRSGSMRTLYNNNTVQKIVERILAIAMKVDKDGVVDMWAFHDDAIEIKPVTENLIEGYVQKYVSGIDYGGTNYAPALQEMIDSSIPKKSIFGIFGKANNEKDPDPAFCVMVTDGVCSDKRASEKVIQGAQDKNIYFQLVGIGSDSFTFLREMGDKYPNCGFVDVHDPQGISDEELYEKLINQEFADWVAKFRTK